MSLVTIRTSSPKVDTFLSGVLFMAEQVLAGKLETKEEWFTVTIDQGEENVITDAEVCEDEESDKS